jgi:N-acetylglucosaminyl-diphospho-decaprenol L-rhamnosyltransferase
VIVTHNSERVISACLAALARVAPGVAAFVVDNASSDASAGRARRDDAQVIVNSENRGFAAAVNQGFRATHAEHVLLLNPDVCLRTSVHALVERAQQTGLAAGQLTDVNGQPQAGFTIRRLPTAAALSFELLGINRLWRSNPVNRRYRYLDRDLNQAGFVEQPAGALLMIRRDVWEKLGGLDESFYPIWFEDVDFCRRALDAGYRIEYVPEVKAVHEGGHSISQIPRGCRERYWYGSLLRYAGKHFEPRAYRAVWLSALLGAIPRAAAGMMREHRFTPARSVVEIFRFRGRRNVSPDRLGRDGAHNS